jgi:hypothetical protein
MSNGPMGGFMPTPAAPSQPPPVKLDTTATSRGNFNNFLKSMNGASSLTPLAPSGMGAMMPQVAPSPISDIDIFNTPVQFMFSGGEIDSFVDEQDSGNNFSSGESTVGDDPDFSYNPDTDSFDVAERPTVTSDEQQENILDAATFVTGTGVPQVNFTNKTIENAFNNLNVPEKIRNELREDLQDRAKDNDLIGALDAAQKESAERDKTSLSEQVLNNIIQASNVNPVEFSRRAFNQEDILGDADVLSLDRIDPFKVEANPVFNPAMAGLPTVDSRFNDTRSTVAQDQARALANLVGGSPPLTDVEKGLQQNQQDLMAQRGRALGPITFGDDLANFQANIRGQTPTEISRVGDDQLAIDEAERAAKGASTVGDDFQTALDLVDARKNRLAATDANVRDMEDIDIATAGRASDFPTLSTVPEDFEENVGRRFNPDRMADIERLYNVNVGQRGRGTGKDKNFVDSSEGDEPTFLAGLGLPSALSILDPERRSRDAMATEVALGRPMGLGETFLGFNAGTMAVDDKGRALVGNPRGTGRFTKVSPSVTAKPITMEDFMANTQKNFTDDSEATGDFTIGSREIPETRLVRNNSGRIIAIKDQFGRVVSGVDPSQKIPEGDNDSPLIRRVLPKQMIKEEEEEKPPNVIGGVPPENPFLPVSSSPFVDSPFTTNVGDFRGTGFTTGDLNRLIAQLTGIKAPTSMAKGGVAEFANGGLIKAVDDFISSGQ